MTAEYCMLILVLLSSLILISITCQIIEVIWPYTKLFTIARHFIFIATMILFPTVMRMMFFMFDVQWFLESIDLKGMWTMIIEVFKIWIQL
jgi:hypothetical protein